MKNINLKILLIFLMAFIKYNLNSQQIKDIEIKKASPKPTVNSPKKEIKKVLPKRVYSVDNKSVVKKSVDYSTVFDEAEKLTNNSEYLQSNIILDKLKGTQADNLEVIVLRLNNHENLAVQYNEMKLYALERNEQKKIIQYLTKMNIKYDEEKEVEIAECHSEIARSFINEYNDSKNVDKIKNQMLSEGISNIDLAIKNNPSLSIDFQITKAEIYYLAGAVNELKASLETLKKSNEPEVKLLAQLIKEKQKATDIKTIQLNTAEIEKLSKKNKIYLLDANKQLAENLNVKIKNAESSLSKGIEYYNNKEYDNALKSLNEAIAQGENKVSNYFVADIHFHNYAITAQKLTEVDRYKTAIRYFEADIALKGTDKSYQHLAYMYEKGLGIIPNLPKAKELYKKSCEMGLEAGCVSLKRINI